MVGISRQREEALENMLKIIKENPGIRPSELNRRLNRGHSASLRSTLIKQGLIRKERHGSAVHYYPIDNEPGH
jgi:predicted transcriptional regulator